jgi:hypothetical protein
MSNTRDAARDYIGRGWPVVPLPPREKAAMIDGWPERTFTPADFGPGNNIAVKMGEPSGLLDVDLDDPIAYELAREFLPATGATFGHGQTPQAHWIYQCDAPGRTRQWKGADGAVTVELRGTGGLTMFPPSVHPSCELVEWATAGEPAPATRQELEAACEDLAAAVRKHKGEPPQEPRPTPPPEAPRSAPAPVNVVNAPDGGQSLLRRAERYADAGKPSVTGGRNSQAFSLAGNLASFDHNGLRLTEAEILDLLLIRWNPRNNPPLSERELAATVHSAMKNGQARPDKPATIAPQAPQAAHAADEDPEPVKPAPMTAADLMRNFPTQREPIIDGLLRRGEVANIVSGAKAFKSWTLMHLALCVILGRLWLGFPTKPGRVLLLDYELSPGTLAKRLQAVASALGLPIDTIGDRLAIEPLRGKRLDVRGVGRYLEHVGAGQFDLIVVDPLYRILPPDLDENANADIAGLYGLLQQYAERADAGIIVVHHASKGDQSAKATTDLGAGAGAQSRAADTHLAIRPHTEPDAAVVSAVLRSFPPVADFAMRWTFPLWELAPDLDPTDLRRPRGRTPKAKEDAPPPPPIYTPQAFAGDFLTMEPQRDAVIVARAIDRLKTERQARLMLDRAEAEKLAYRWRMPKDRKVYFANRPQPALDIAPEDSK